jgi:hypothetical protein
MTFHTTDQEILSFQLVLSMSPPPSLVPSPAPTFAPSTAPTVRVADDRATTATTRTRVGENETTNDLFNKPATITRSGTPFLKIAAMAITALVVRKYKRAMTGGGSSDDVSIFTGSPLVFTNNNNVEIPSPV